MEVLKQRLEYESSSFNCDLKKRLNQISDYPEVTKQNSEIIRTFAIPSPYILPHFFIHVF